MRIDELEDALAELAASQPPVDNDVWQIRRRARRRRRGQAIGGACLLAALLVAGAMWLPRHGGRPLDVAAGPSQSQFPATTSTPTSAGPDASDRLDCAGSTATQVEILSVDGGAPTPEEEIGHFLSTSGVAVPTGAYVPSAATGGEGTPGSSAQPDSLTQPEQRIFVHRSSNGTVDAQLTVIRSPSGWRVDAATWCS